MRCSNARAAYDFAGCSVARKKTSSSERRTLQVGVLRPGLVQRPVEEALALVQDQQVSAQVFHQGQQVRADDDRGSGGGSLGDRSFEGPDGVRVQARQGFVEENGLGIVQIGAADRHLLPHPAREFLRHRVALLHQLELLQEGFRPGGEIGHAIGRGDEFEVFPDRQGVEQLGVVGDVGQLALGGQRNR